MADADDPRALGGGVPQGLDRLSLVARAGPLADVLPEQVDPAVLLVTREYLVAPLEAQRPSDRVQPRGSVRREDEVVRIGADVRREPPLGGVHELGVAAVAGEELDRLALQLALVALVGLEDGHGAGTERAVVQEDHVRVEQKQLLERCMTMHRLCR